MNHDQNNSSTPETYNPQGVIKEPVIGDYPMLNNPLLGKIAEDEPPPPLSFRKLAPQVAGLAVFLLTLLALPATIYLTSQRTNVRLRASEPRTVIYSSITKTEPVALGESPVFLAFQGEPLPSNIIINSAEIRVANIDDTSEDLDIKIRGVLAFDPDITDPSTESFAWHQDSIQWPKDSFYGFDVTNQVQEVYEKVQEIKTIHGFIIESSGSSGSQRTIHTSGPYAPQLVIRYQQVEDLQ